MNAGLDFRQAAKKNRNEVFLPCILDSMKEEGQVRVENARRGVNLRRRMSYYLEDSSNPIISQTLDDMSEEGKARRYDNSEMFTFQETRYSTTWRRPAVSLPYLRVRRSSTSSTK